jgi:hypothetical protein
LTVEIPARLLGPGSYQGTLSFRSRLDASGPKVDEPGVVCEFTVGDTRTSFGNNRRGYLSTILNWTSDAS